ncbi:universal stress protein [Mesorhizobium sp. M00.F.Ca.ET.216.01.1.1]|nr:universal stress protein [Mesorhizobium sp. M00.F.Ca.ET.216.01.1.1]
MQFIAHSVSSAKGLRMSYKSIIVNLAVDAPPAAIVKVGVELAERFGARLIGLAAADVPPLVATGHGMVYEGEVMQIQRTEIEKQLAELRAEFERLVPASISSEWGQDVCSPTRFLSVSARAADLIVTGGHDRENVYRAVDIGSLALGTGRPVLVAASNVEHVLAKTVLVAWKDTREARRAIADALPFLARANEVVVATVGTDRHESIRDSLADIAVFLEHHGVMARTELITGEADGDRLVAFARSVHADLIVSGAYGHSRLREWAFGGVTRTLIQESGINRMMSY